MSDQERWPERARLQRRAALRGRRLAVSVQGGSLRVREQAELAETVADAAELAGVDELSIVASAMTGGPSVHLLGGVPVVRARTAGFFGHPTLVRQIGGAA